MPSRALIVVVATVFGVVAALSAYAAVQSAPSRAFHNAPLASVYVVRATVPREESAGTAFAHGLIVRTQVPRKYVPTGALTTLDDISTRVAGTELAAGEVVVRGMFVSVANNPGAAADALPPGDVAVTVSVSPAADVGGAVQPQDKVDLLVDVKGTEEAYLYRSVTVLAVGSKLVPTPGTTPSAVPVEVITFAMSAADAAHIPPTTSQSGPITQGVYLSLEAPGDQGATVQPISLDNLIPGVQLAPQHATPTNVGTTGGASQSSSTGGSTSGGGNRANEP